MNITKHAVERINERNISLHLIKEAYDISMQHKDRHFVAVFFSDDNILVVIDTTEGNIVTVMHYTLRVPVGQYCAKWKAKVISI